MTPLLTVGPRFDQAQSSLRKHPFLLALRRWERFETRNVPGGEERGETDVFAG